MNMSKFSKRIAPYIKEELLKSGEAMERGDYSKAFTHLEDAHVLGQTSTYWHVKVHTVMLRWGVKQRDFKEVIGQLGLAVGAAVVTPINAVPYGARGGIRGNPGNERKIKPALAEIIAKAKAS